MNKISKPRANFMVQFLTDANQPSWSKFRTQVRVLGKFPSYQYRWHLPEYVEVDEGEISGTVDVNGPIFIHDLTVSGLVLGDQITFEVFYLDGDAKRGAVANYVIDLDHNSKDAGISIKSVEDKSLRRKIIQ